MIAVSIWSIILTYILVVGLWLVAAHRLHDEKSIRTMGRGHASVIYTTGNDKR